jgi:hypothetical protein
MLSAVEYKALLRKYIALRAGFHGYSLSPAERSELVELETDVERVALNGRMQDLDAFPAGRDTDSALLPPV